MNALKIGLALYLVAVLSACGGGAGNDSESTENSPDSGVVDDPVLPENPEQPEEPEQPEDPNQPIEENIPPQKVIANAYSGTSIGLNWQANNQTVKIYRNDQLIAETSDAYYIDTNLQINTEYHYSLTTGSLDNAAETALVTAKTLINNSNSGENNGAETVIMNDRLQNFDACGITSGRDTSLNVAEENLNACLDAMLEHNQMAAHLEDMRAFSARVRREQSPEKVELGMRLFHNKSLSANEDVSCSSCHHPALGCGGDDLSMPIGVNAQVPALLGPGRIDNQNVIPIVPRNSPATCNTSLWTRGLFWDNRVSLMGRRVSTDSEDVDQLVDDAVGNGTLALLMAQAHFPITAPPEMGDVTDFGLDGNTDSDLTLFREDIIAASLDHDKWGGLFAAAYGDSTITFSRIAEAIAAYEAVQIFIDNPFFDYVDGNQDAITSDEKRGAITFMASNAGCTFCHAGAFFTTQAQLPGNYPQIGIGTDEEGSGADLGAIGLTGPGAFRAPTLLNVAITGPWGHNGQFATLKRNVEHYSGHGASIAAYFENNEMCDLPQFENLEDCENQLAPNGLTLSQSILDGNTEFSNNLSEAEVDLIVLFLNTLTDPDAKNIESNAIQFLIPPRDGGPDGKQLDAIDSDGNAL